jgi:hydroxyacylglutathione hydrolase
MLIEQIPVGEMAVFCYLVGCEETRQAAAIDPAGDTERLLTFLQEKKLRLAYIVSTHGHADHTCGNQALAARTGAKTVMHGLDDDFFSSAEGRRRNVCPSRKQPLHRRHSLRGCRRPYGSTGSIL